MIDLRRFAACALVLLGVCAPTAVDAQPAATQQAGDRADSLAVPGSELTVYLMTMGQGDQVWERFGHNAIGIRDRRAGTDIVYNWGIFSFDQPGFIRRFLRGEMMYWMAPFPAGATIAEYMALNRTIVVQELNLAPVQRLALRDFLLWNARDENKFYEYNYFLDNCSTRVRDALDQVLGGAIRLATEHVPTSFSFRDHALRLMAGDVLTTTGIDIGLGRPADRPITAWEEMFIPMRLRDRLRDIEVPDETGRMVPLVTSERVIFEANRPPERERPPARTVPFFVIGLLLAAGVTWLVRRGAEGSTGARRAAFSLAIVWSIVIGIVGLLLVLLRVATRHEFAWHNANLFVYNPLWLVLAVLAVIAMFSVGAARATVHLSRVTAWLSILVLPAMLLPMVRQDSLAVILLAVPMNLIAAFTLRYSVPVPTDGTMSGETGTPAGGTSAAAVATSADASTPADPAAE